MAKKYIFITILIILMMISFFINWKTNKSSKKTLIKTTVSEKEESYSVKPLPKPLPEPSTIHKNCKSSVDDILKEYNVYWGDNFLKDASLKFGATFYVDESINLNLKSKIYEYYSCTSISQGINNCNNLPNQKMKNRCNEYILLYNFLKYASGNDQDEEKCIKFVENQYEISKNETSSIDSLILKLFSPDRRKDFCKKIKNVGIEKICSEYSGVIGTELLETCKSFFPENLEKSLAQKDIREYFSAYMALKEKKETYCETGNKALCLATITGNDSYCDIIKSDIIDTYCDYLSNFFKTVEEAKKAQEEKRKKEIEEEEVRKKQEEEKKKKEIEEADRKKQEGEIIKKARELLRKNSGGENE